MIHTTLAYRTTHHDWDWATADAQFKHAFELNPNYAVCHHWYSHFLTAVGRTEESLSASRRCLELDPLDLAINIHMAWHYQFARQYEQAIEQCWKASEMHPNSFWPAYFFGLAFEQQGQIDRAAEEFQIAAKMSGDYTFVSAALGHLYGTAGNAAEARAVFNELSARSKCVYVPAYDIALVCTGLGWKRPSTGLPGASPPGALRLDDLPQGGPAPGPLAWRCPFRRITAARETGALVQKYQPPTKT